MVHLLYCLIIEFERKLDLWKQQTTNQKLVNFPRLSQQSVNETSGEGYKQNSALWTNILGRGFKI